MGEALISQPLPPWLDEVSDLSSNFMNCATYEAAKWA